MIAMPDSIAPGNIPMGYPAVLGYVDGAWPTASRLPELFPGVRVLSLTVLGGNAIADGCDVEPGDMTPDVAAEWVGGRLDAGAWRPVVYASVANMGPLLAQFAADDIPRSHVRLLTAHYGAGKHICGPKTCGQLAIDADGTQWTDQFPGVGGTKIDMSALNDDFFGPVEPASAWVFGAVRGLTVQPGHTSALLSWSAPGNPAPLGVHHYQVTIRRDGRDVPSYPRDVAKGGNPQAWQGGSLEPATAYEALVRAMTADGSHASPWAAVTFTTGHG